MRKKYRELQEDHQILKTRDDRCRVYIEPNAESSEAQESFQLSDHTECCSWAEKENDPFGPEKLRHRIEPWLTALVQSDHLSLLIGSGLTNAIHRVATCKPPRGMDPIGLDIFKDEIEAEAKRMAGAARRQCGNFEDEFRAAADLLRGLEILISTKLDDAPKQRKVQALRSGLMNALGSFADSVLEGERNLVSALPAKREKAFGNLVSFLMSFGSRTGTRERLHLFTTNYDRYIEAGADVAGLHLIDRFVGTLAPVFRASRLDIDLHYNPPGIRGEPRYLEGVARFTKLHGSVDWVDHDRQIQRFGLPFGAQDTEPYLAAPGLKNANALQLMIYPNAAKERETASYPYVELFRDFAAAICRPNSTLFCFGYGFGDEHINRVIEDMLTIPSAHLVVISHGDPLGRIMEMYERLGRHAQVTLLIGDHLADLETLVKHYLPKPAIDLTTIRMADLLKIRWSTTQGENDTDENSKTNEEESVQ